MLECNLFYKYMHQRQERCDFCSFNLLCVVCVCLTDTASSCTLCSTVYTVSVHWSSQSCSTSISLSTPSILLSFHSLSSGMPPSSTLISSQFVVSALSRCRLFVTEICLDLLDRNSTHTVNQDSGDRSNLQFHRCYSSTALYMKKSYVCVGM